MNWIRIWFFGLLSMYMAGLTGRFFFLFIGRLAANANPYLTRIRQQTIIILHLFPVTLTLFCYQRMFFSTGRVVTTGCFFTDSHPTDDTLCGILFVIWCVGLIKKCTDYILSSKIMNKLFKSSRPVINSNVTAILREVSEQKKLHHFPVILVNDQIPSPVSIGYVQPQIILPHTDYSNKEMHMVLEHELTHLRNQDLIWRRMMLVASLIHWYDPFLYRMGDQVIYTQEVICDLESSRNACYSQKEYAIFLVKSCSNILLEKQGIALAESKAMVIRRIEEMVKNKRTRKTGKLLAAGSALFLALASLVPSQVVSAKMVELEEDRIYDLEIDTEYPEQVPKTFGQILIDKGDTDINEIDLTPEILPYSKLVSLDKTIEANTRVIYMYRQMEAGDKIVISAACGNDSATFKAGVKNSGTGEVSYVSGSDVVYYSFTVPKDGKYSAFIENNNNFSIDIEGFADYQD